jgi:glycerol-3-phosphate cytidylyltransferase
MVYGYTTGAFDLFHIGHLNILRAARSMCDKLIVAVTVDELIQRTKHRSPVIPFAERVEIVRSIKYVDVAIPQVTLDKYEAWKKLKYNILFVGDDWYETNSWQGIEKELEQENVPVLYFPYTKSISTTMLRKKLI